MAEDLKKFYKKILALVEENHSQKDAAAATKILEAWKEGQPYSALELLQKLGLSDVYNLVECLRGQDIQQLSGEKIAPEPIVLDYWKASLPFFQHDLGEIGRGSASMANHFQALHQQCALWEKMLQGVSQKDFFPIMQSLIEAYPQAQGEAKALIVATLQKVGRPVVLALVHCLFHQEKGMEGISDLLHSMGDLAIPALIVALHYPEESIRVCAAQVLRKIKSKEALSALLESLVDPAWKVRQIVVETLGEMNSPEAISGLLKALQDKHAAVRLEAAKALGKVKSPKVLPYLLRLLQDPSLEIRKEAVESMAKFGDEASFFLASALENDNLVVRKIASRILAEVGNKGALPSLRQAMQDKDISVREKCVASLGRILEGGEAVALLEQALEDKAPLVRFTAIQTMMDAQDRIGESSLLYLLNKALKDSEPLIRQRAHTALSEIFKKRTDAKS